MSKSGKVLQLVVQRVSTAQRVASHVPDGGHFDD